MVRMGKGRGGCGKGREERIGWQDRAMYRRALLHKTQLHNYTQLCTYICTYVPTYVHMYLHMYICTYTYVHIQ